MSLHPPVGLIDRRPGEKMPGQEKHKGIDMRTTLDLPDELLKRAKIAAIERGMTLRDLVAEGLKQTLEGKRPAPRRRAKLPNIPIARDAPILRMTVEDVKALEAEQDAEHLRAVYRRR